MIASAFLARAAVAASLVAVLLAPVAVWSVQDIRRDGFREWWRS